MERLNKFMAAAGVASRRKCDELISDGRVTVNGDTVTSLGTQIDLQKDKVALDGKIVKPLAGHVYIAMNKPQGFVTTVKDTHNRPTVIDLIPGVKRRLYPVGRLDMDSEGLLLMTDDGNVAFALTHPSREIPKTYVARLKNKVSDEDMVKLRRGIMLEDGMTLPTHTKFLDDSRRLVEIELREGRNRQIRRMFKALDNEVMSLVRVKLGPIWLGELKKGTYRYLTSSEVADLRTLTQAVGQGSNGKPNMKTREVAAKDVSKRFGRELHDKGQNKAGLSGNDGSKKVLGGKKELGRDFGGNSRSTGTGTQKPGVSRSKGGRG